MALCYQLAELANSAYPQSSPSLPNFTLFLIFTLDFNRPQFCFKDNIQMRTWSPVCVVCSLQTELLRTDQEGFLKELDEGLLSRQSSESSLSQNRCQRCVERCRACCLFRAALGLTCTMFLLVIGLVLLVMSQEAFEGTDGERLFTASGFFIAMGCFGTFSGVTNLVANVSLFYGIPYLPGTGLVTAQYMVMISVCSYTP